MVVCPALGAGTGVGAVCSDRAPTRRGPHFFQRNGGKKAKGKEVLSPWNPILWFMKNLSVGILK